MSTRRKSRFILSVLTALAMAPAFAGAPKDEDHIIDLGNWLEHENNIWAFQNTSAILPSLVISRGTTPTSPLEYAPVNLDTFEYKGIVDGKRTRMKFTEYLERSDTDVILVMQNGKIVF